MTVAHSQSIRTHTKPVHTWEITNTRKALRHKRQSLSPEEAFADIWRVSSLTDLKTIGSETNTLCLHLRGLITCRMGKYHLDGPSRRTQHIKCMVFLTLHPGNTKIRKGNVKSITTRIKRMRAPQVWWCRPVLPVHGTLRKEDCGLESSLG